MMRPTRTLPTAAAIAAAGLFATTAAGLAQEASPGSTSAYPLDIREGTCADLGNVIFPLGEISRDLMVHSEEVDPAPVGGIESQQVAMNLTLVGATLDELTSAPHALDIREGAAEADARVACGDIAGRVVDDGTLVIRLDEHDDSGYLGIALFLEHDSGNTAVYSMLTEPESKVESPAPADAETQAMASPAPGDAGSSEGDELTIDIDVEGRDEADVNVDVEEPDESPEA